MTYSVVQRINAIHQPWGGYVRAKSFQKTTRNDDIQLHENENIAPCLTGLAVDYLTRYMMGETVQSAFDISLRGSKVIKKERTCKRLLSKIHGIDDESIKCACKAVGFDVCFRSSVWGYKPVGEINPNRKTISNIRTMVLRCIDFWKDYGPIISTNFTFEGGYTETVVVGDGDYLTNDTLWDFKVSKKGLTSQQTLQLLMYYIMGCHSIHPEFININKLGIYNPRLNIVYLLEISQISEETINTVSSEVIGYK